MPSQRTSNILNILAIICATWYIVFGWVWAWYINVMFVFPFAIIGFFLWLAGRKAERKGLSRTAGIMLIVGTATSFGALLFYAVSRS